MEINFSSIYFPLKNMMNKLRGSWLICPRRLQLHILQTGGHSGGAEIHIPGQGPSLRQPQPGLEGE